MSTDPPPPPPGEASASAGRPAGAGLGAGRAAAERGAGRGDHGVGVVREPGGRPRAGGAAHRGHRHDGLRGRRLHDREQPAQPVLPAHRGRHAQRDPRPADRPGQAAARRRRLRQPHHHALARAARRRDRAAHAGRAAPRARLRPVRQRRGARPRDDLRRDLPAAGLLLRALHDPRPGAQRQRPLRRLHVGTGPGEHRRGHRPAVVHAGGLPHRGGAGGLDARR